MTKKKRGPTRKDSKDTAAAAKVLGIGSQFLPLGYVFSAVLCEFGAMTSNTGIRKGVPARTGTTIHSKDIIKHEPKSDG